MRNRIVKNQRTFIKQYPKNKRWKYNSPYWDYVYDKSPTGKDGEMEIREPAQANPDVINEEHSIYSTLWNPSQEAEYAEDVRNINWKAVLTKKQFKVLQTLYILVKKENSPNAIVMAAKILGISRQGLDNHLRLIRQKMIKVFENR